MMLTKLSLLQIRISDWNVLILNSINQQIKIQSQNLLSQRIRKRLYKTFGTSVMNRPMSPPPSLIATLIKILSSNERNIFSVPRSRTSRLALLDFCFFGGVPIGEWFNNVCNKTSLQILIVLYLNKKNMNITSSSNLAFFYHQLAVWE